MTREEAIKVLENATIEPTWGGSFRATSEALDMAIEALKREPCEDLISKADVVDAIESTTWYHQNRNKDMVSGAISDEHQAWYKADDVYEALEAVPSADRPRGEWTLLTEERPVDDYEIIATVYWPGYGDSTIAVGHIDRFDNWHLYSPIEGELIKGFEVIAWKTLPEPYCGADMRGDTK